MFKLVAQPHGEACLAKTIRADKIRVRRACRLLAALVWPVLLCACAVARPDSCAPAGPAGPVGPVGPVAWVVDQGWHTEIGLPAQEITGPLSVFRTVFPGARVLMFGFGKRTWITARVESLSELLMGPIPGPGAIQVIGLRVEPGDAYGGAGVVRLSLRPDQAARLERFVWTSIGKTRTGQPRLISPGLFPGSLFYAASRGYAPDYTCNTWSAEALQSAGLPVSPDGVVLAGGVLDQLARVGGSCLVPDRAPE